MVERHRRRMGRRSISGQKNNEALVPYFLSRLPEYGSALLIHSNRGGAHGGRRGGTSSAFGVGADSAITGGASAGRRSVASNSRATSPGRRTHAAGQGVGER